jgi:hypothetical protein
MGGGSAPGPIGHDGGAVPDDGTTALMPSPSPSPIGLKGGSAKGESASLGDGIVGYARNRMGQVVGNGECFTLVDRALRHAGARSAADFGEVTPDADYTWGTPLSLGELAPGDVIQFRGYQCDLHVESPTEISDESQTRPHHTAIVERVGDNGLVTVLEQNIPPGTGVSRNRLYFSGGTFSSGETTTRVTVHGTFWFFRAQAR